MTRKVTDALPDMGAGIRLARERYRYSQRQLASVAGLTLSVLTKIEGGGATFDLATAEAIAGAMNVQLDVLFGRLPYPDKANRCGRTWFSQIFLGRHLHEYYRQPIRPICLIRPLHSLFTPPFAPTNIDTHHEEKWDQFIDQIQRILDEQMDIASVLPDVEVRQRRVLRASTSWRTRVGEAIDSSIASSGFGAPELAKRCGISTQTLRNARSGATVPDFFTVLHLADVLSLQIDELIGRDLDSGAFRGDLSLADFGVFRIYARSCRVLNQMSHDALAKAFVAARRGEFEAFVESKRAYLAKAQPPKATSGTSWVFTPS